MAILKRDKSVIYGLAQDLQQISDDTGQLTLDRKAADGDLTLLETTSTTNLVSAINSLLTSVSGDTGDNLKIANNLNDVADVTVSRTNLGVYSTTQVDTAIQAAEADLGTNFQVATIAERDALGGLDTNDRVFVADRGDATWAIYKPTAFDVGGLATSWTLLSSQYSLEATITPTAMRTEYLSNADTNAFVNADQTKVGHLSVTSAIDLDDVALKAELGQDILGINADSTEVPSADSVRPYLDEAARIGGTASLKETVTVTAPDTVTLTYAPKGGVAGIMNFATVRYTDVNGVSFDAPLVSTATPNVFTLQLGTSGSWDGNSVTVQYAHVPATGPTVDEQGYADQGLLDEPAV